MKKLVQSVFSNTIKANDREDINKSHASVLSENLHTNESGPLKEPGGCSINDTVSISAVQPTLRRQ